jgi:uncharacterized protein
LAIIYQKGIIIEKDLEKSKRYFEIAVSHNYSSAMTNLGVMYTEGVGVEQDYEKAKDYYIMGASLYNSVSMYNLGLLYLHDFQDADKAREYFEKSIIHGTDMDYIDPLKNLISLYERGRVKKDDKVLKWYENEEFRQTKKRIMNLKKIFENGFGNEESKIYQKFIYHYEVEIPNRIYQSLKSFHFIDICFY